MESQRNTPSDHDLRAVVTHAELEAHRLLESADGAPLDVVAWLSAHVAAVERAVYPVVKRALPDGQSVLAAHREINARLIRTLRVIERHHSGDVLAAGLSNERLLSNVHDLVDEHQQAETELVDRLFEVLSDDDQASLTAAYESALEHAPTRPHPHLSRGRLMFRLDGLRDRILDAMDGRHVPVPRLVKEPVTPGRWGSYVLGQPHDQGRDAS